MRCLAMAAVASLILGAPHVAPPVKPPPDYPFRLHVVRLVPFGSENPATGMHSSGTVSTDPGTGSAVLFDQTGALEALQFRISIATGCFSHVQDFFYRAGGYYPARWVNRKEIALVRNIVAGKIQECSIEVKRSAVPATAEYRRFSAMGPDKMARIYERTSLTNLPVRQAEPGK